MRRSDADADAAPRGAACLYVGDFVFSCGAGAPEDVDCSALGSCSLYGSPWPTHACAGEECDEGIPGGAGPCAELGRCRYGATVDSFCRDRQAEGEPCERDVQCTTGFCARPDPEEASGTCRAPTAAVGADCGGEIGCIDSACADGRCTHVACLYW